ncbi:MAG: hypothetical protein ACP5XB_32060, partial [Isosphaeraceae bacterium]
MAMAVRAFSKPASGAAVCALLIATTVLAAGKEGRPRLDKDVLSRSRGSNQSQGYCGVPCDQFNQMQLCTNPDYSHTLTHSISHRH